MVVEKYDNGLKTKETKCKPRMKVTHNKAIIVPFSHRKRTALFDVCLFQSIISYTIKFSIKFMKIDQKSFS